MAAPNDRVDDAYFDKHLHCVGDLMPQYLIDLATRAMRHRAHGVRTALSALDAGRPDLAAGVLRSLLGDES